jgi:hypothetical protein
MSETPSSRDLIVKALAEKAVLKLEVLRNTEEAFKLLRKELEGVQTDLNNTLSGIDKRIHLKNSEKGPYDLELKFSDDILIFSMHTDVFAFEDAHPVRKTSYLTEDPGRGFCGMIMIYNFLSDSFKFKRENDVGLLIARIFVNKEGHFFVEGKRQLGFLYNDFEALQVNQQNLRAVIESAILYSIHFDIYAPPFDQMKMITVQQVMDKSMSGLVSTGKRLGFKFQSDEDLIQ